MAFNCCCRPVPTTTPGKEGDSDRSSVRRSIVKDANDLLAFNRKLDNDGNVLEEDQEADTYYMARKNKEH